MTESHIQPKRDYTWPIVVGVFVAFWVVYVLFMGPRAPSDFDVSGPGSPADYNWSLEDLDGRPVKFSQFEGKAVFLNIWATWCPPCIREMPSIARLTANPRLQGKNIEFVCVATDDSIDDVRRFLQGKGWPMTILHASALPAMFLTEGIPATFILSPDGRLVSSTVGAFEWDGDEVVRKLEEVAAIPPKTPQPSPAG